MDVKPRRATFEVALPNQGRECRTGYVLGDFGTHRERYFWAFTHLPTGVKVSGYPCYDKKADALTRLTELSNGGLSELERALIEKHGNAWGLGL